MMRLTCVAMALILSPSAMAQGADFSERWVIDLRTDAQRRDGVECGRASFTLIQDEERLTGSHAFSTPGCGRINEGGPGSVVGVVSGDTALLRVTSGRNGAQVRGTATLKDGKLVWETTGEVRAGTPAGDSALILNRGVLTRESRPAVRRAPPGQGTDVPSMLKRAGFGATAAPGWDCRGPSYSVSWSDGQLVTRRSAGPAAESPERLSFAGQRYQYEARNRGEWGGELSVRWPDGSTRSLVRDNTRALVPVGDQLFVFTGLAHLTSDDGAVWVVDDFDRAPRVSKVTLLPSMPELVSIDPLSGEFLMVSSHAVMRLRGTRTLSIDSIRQFRLRYPTSVVLQRPYYAIGACGAVVVVHVPTLDDRMSESMTPTVTYYAKPSR